MGMKIERTITARRSALFARRSALFAALIAALSLGAAAAGAQAVRAADSSGKALALKAPAARIVSLSPAATELVFAIGAGAALVGDTSYCDYPEAAKSLPKVGGFAATTISIERIAALKPDLVISAGSMHAQVADALAKLGIPTFAYDPSGFDGIASGMEAIGALCGKSAEASKAADAMLASIEAVKAKIASLSAGKRPIVFWEVYDEPLMTCGSSSFPHAILEAGGGRDLFSDLAGSWPRVSSEEVIRRAPDYIMGADDHGDKLTVEAVAKRPGWALIPAVKNRRIVLLPADLVSRAGPRVAEGVRAVAAALYPGLFK